MHAHYYTISNLYCGWIADIMLIKSIGNVYYNNVISTSLISVVAPRTMESPRVDKKDARGSARNNIATREQWAAGVRIPTLYFWTVLKL